MPNDIPDWTSLNQVNLVGGLSKANLGDVAAAALGTDVGTETISAGTLNAGNGVLASFKAAAGQVISRVGAVAAFVVGTAGAVTGNFGQGTTAGNLLLAWVTADKAASEPATVAAGWVKVVSVNGQNGWAAIWAKPNCGAAEAAPQFTSGGGTQRMLGGLAEFSGAALAGVVDQTGSADLAGTTITIQNGGVDAAFGDLIVMADYFAGVSFASAVETFNNGAAAVLAGSVQQNFVFNGFNRLHGSYGIVPSAVVAQPLGVAEWAYDVSGFAAPAAGSGAVVTLAASAVGKRYTAQFVSGSIAATAATAAETDFLLQDGVNTIWQQVLGHQAAIGAGDHFEVSGLGYPGTVNTKMVLTVGGAVAGDFQRVGIGAYLR